jgi:hypothetical protein
MRHASLITASEKSCPEKGILLSGLHALNNATAQAGHNMLQSKQTGKINWK